MLKRLLFTLSLAILVFSSHAQIVYHNAVKDNNGNLMPWYNPNHGSSYDHCLGLVWNFWQNIPLYNGYKSYLLGHTYSPNGSNNQVGGDQFAMTISSWALYYAYTGDTNLLNDMIYSTEYYLAGSMSKPTDAWPNIPYPSNYTNNSAPQYDGDYLLGKNYTQPDKAGSLGAELLTLYKITGNEKYKDVAIKIANTLAAKVDTGSATLSPYRFKVNAVDGTPAPNGVSNPPLAFCGNLAPTLRLFEELSARNWGNTVAYDSAYSTLKKWIIKYPLQNGNWGNFFENIVFISNAQTNAVTMAQYILERPDWGATYNQDGRKIMDATLALLGSHAYDTVGTTAIFEQTADLKEGGSHTSRFGSIELLYAENTGDTSRVEQAIRQLDWATYLVDFDGKCRFSPRNNSIWFTDGYVDFVRHYIRAMGYYPKIAPDSANHCLRSTSVIKSIQYHPKEINYSTYDSAATETFRLTSKPLQVLANGAALSEVSNPGSEGYTWEPYTLGGVLKVKHSYAKNVDILWYPSGIADESSTMNFDVYPNPTADKVRLRFAGSTGDAFTVSIIDITGRTLIQAQLSNGSISHTLDVSGLASGNYFVHLSSNGNSATKRLGISR
jgi:hypothetical protein